VETYVTVYFGSAFAAMLLVPVVFKLAEKYSLYDEPDPRKAHLKPVPRVGGFAFVVSTLALIIPIFFLDNTIGQSFFSAKKQMIALLSCASFVYMVGLIDDIKPLRGILKLLSLILAAIVFCYSGATIQTIHLGSWFTVNTAWAAIPLTVCWIVGITVCIGLIDGLDGLAAGIAAMVCTTLVVVSLWISQIAMAVLMLALLGGITGFLIFNFYPAKIFMGDGGSLFLGFMIGASSVICQAKTSTFVALAIPFLVLGMPILDTGLVFAFRGFIKRRSLFAADNNHFHHRLLRLGLKHRSVVLVMYAITAICASLGIFMLTAESKISAQLLFAGLILLFTMFACLQKGRYLKLYRGLKRNLAIAHQARKQTRNFEIAQDKMRQSQSFDAWWQVLCAMGENLCFKSLSLLSRDNGRFVSNCQWNALKKCTNNSRIVEINLPLRSYDNKEFLLRACIYTDGYLESSGHQVKLLTRLIDEFPLPKSQLTGKASDKLEFQQNSNIEDESYFKDIDKSEVDSSKANFTIETTKGHKSTTNALGTPSSSLRYIFKQNT